MKDMLILGGKIFLLFLFMIGVGAFMKKYPHKIPQVQQKCIGGKFIKFYYADTNEFAIIEKKCK